jgi:hypothetical protein
MSMNPRLLRPTASGAVAVALDSSGNVIPSVSYSEGGENYVAHIFNTSGSLRVLRPVSVEYLVIAGGGGGGRDMFSPNRSAGGGGAGGYRSSVVGSASGANSSAESTLALIANTYTVTVGAGGVGGINTNGSHRGGNGQDSSFSSITATGGGGGGGHRSDSGADRAGLNGGSGGGAAGGALGGTGVSLQGTAGGNGALAVAAPFNSAGGGGAGAAGAAATDSPSFVSPGGDGLESPISGSAVFRGGGGGAVGSADNSSGGAGGGGAGGGVAGTPNTGGGGGANRGGNGGAGGSGIVIVRYKRAASLSLNNADAQDWVNRVYANGGTVSTSTASAVNTFCNDIDAAGIRDRFYRLNLFCGTGLNAALVPVYRGTSLGGTQYGNATDTNNGPFVSGDYADTGATGGLKGGGSTKYLDTGFASNVLGQTDRHMSAFFDLATSVNNRYWFGTDQSGCGSSFWAIGSSSTTSAEFRSGIPGAGSVASSGKIQLLVSGNGTAQSYLNGSASTSISGTAYTAPAQNIFVHALNRCGSATDFGSCRVQAYSLGAAFTAQQAADFYTAILAFQTAMGRV